MKTGPLARAGVALAILVLSGSFAPGVRAACPSSVPMGHLLNVYFRCAVGGPAGAFAWKLGDPVGVNTGDEEIVCEGRDLVRCFTNAGVPGDGRSTIETDWMNPGISGCPVGDTGPERVVLAFAVGRRLWGSSILGSFSGSVPDLGYAVEAIHPFALDDSTPSPMNCDHSVLVQDRQVGWLDLEFRPLTMTSDCDPGTYGELVGACDDAFRPQVTHGTIHTRTQSCDAPIDLRLDGWTETGVVPDAVTGRAFVQIDTPSPGQCNLAGISSRIDGVETPAVTAFVFDADCRNDDGDLSYTCIRDCDALECNADCDDTDPAIYPGAQEVCDGRDNDCDFLVDEDPGLCEVQEVDDIVISFSSPLGRGSGTVSWNTRAEIAIRGFNVIVFTNQGQRVQQNDVLIPCLECTTGLPASYTFLIPKHKGGRGIFVELLREQGPSQFFGPAQRER